MSKRKKKKQNNNQQPKLSEPEKYTVQEAEVTTEKGPEDNKPEPKSETPDKQEESYFIYEYLKKNPAVLIAVVSALVAVVTMVLKLGSYLYHIAYLNYWNIDSKFVSTPETYWLEDIALSFALLVSGMIYMGLMNETVSTFKKHKYFIKKIKTILKANEYKFNKSIVVTKKKNAKQSKKKESNNNYDIKMNLEAYKEVKKWCKQASISAWMQVIVHFFLLEIIWGIVMYIVYLSQGNKSNNSLIFFCLVILIFGLLVAISCYHIVSVDKEISKNDLNKSLIKLENNDYELPMFPIRKIGKLGVRFYLSNNYIFRGCAFMFVIFISFVIIEHEQGEDDAKNLKDHICVTTIDNTDYAIIAQDSDNIIAERIDIKDKPPAIYDNEQILIPKENIEIKVYSFESVSRKKS